MRHKILWLGFILTVALGLIAGDGSLAQPPGKKKGDGGDKFGKKGKGNITVDMIVDRIMAFDKNNTGKITKDDLPERMQHLIAMGDTNKDGALDKDEVKELATTLEALVGLFNTGGPGGPGGGKGFGKGGGPKGPPGAGLQEILEDLGLKGDSKEKATALVTDFQEKTKKAMDAARDELFVQMKEVLSVGDYKVFKEAADRKKGPPPFEGGK